RADSLVKRKRPCESVISRAARPIVARLATERLTIAPATGWPVAPSVTTPLIAPEPSGNAGGGARPEVMTGTPRPPDPVLAEVTWAYADAAHSAPEIRHARTGRKMRPMWQTTPVTPDRVAVFRPAFLPPILPSF